MSIRDRWENLWKMNVDPKGIFAGVKDLEFILKRTSTAGPRVEYDFVYTPEDPNNDPFKNTTFVQFGKSFPTALTKLDKWQQSQETPYKNLIKSHFDHPPTKILRLEGEKEVGDDTVAITLFLLPDACSKFGNAPPYVDLMAPMIRSKVDDPILVVFEDGTGHANPK